MTQDKDSKNNFSGLRTRAEEMLRSASLDLEDISPLSPDEVQKLAHNLMVHQIELEMQNEDLRQAQIKLEEMKDKYLDLYDFAPVGYMTLNDRGLILEANLTAVRLLGVERTSLIKMFFSHFVCEEFTDTFYLYLQQVFESQSKQTCEIKLTRKDRTLFYAQLESIPVKDESGQSNRCRTTLSDITDRKRAEEALRTKTHRLNERVKELDCLFAMSKLVEKSDISLDHILQGVVDIIPPSWQYPEIACANMILQDREFKTENYKVPVSKQSADIILHGEHAGFLEVGYLEEAPESDEGPFLKEERNLINTITERLGRIIERKLGEEVLWQSEERYRTVANFTYDWEYWVSPEDNLLFVSPSCERITGYSPEEFIRDPDLMNRIVHPDDSPRMMEHFHLSRKVDFETPYSLDFQIIHRDGQTRWINHVCQPVFGQAGQQLGRRACNRDITDRKQAEQDRENLRAQLLQSQKMETMGTLAAGIAHDFNNMLQVIFSYSDILLAHMNEGDPGYKGLKSIVKTAEDAADLVQRIRIFGRRAEMNLIPLDLNHQVDEVTKLLSSSLPKMIEMDIHLTKDPVIIKADPSQITQMVMNLAVNANEAMSQGGRLSIQTENIVLDNDYCRVHLGVKPGPYVMLTVSDTGIGIDKGLLERIFDPFYSTKTRDYRKGTGLGLSVVQGIVHQHGGHITVESDVGKGTTFRMYFPALEHEIVPEYVEKKIPYPAGGTETILLVEDMDLVRELGVTILEKFGYTVLSACDGQEALDVYEKEQGNISLVILDIIMPRMDGKECLEQLLRINPAVKVIISSGVGQEDLINEVVEIGAKGAVNKPYGMRQLLAMVREVLDGD